MIGIAGCPEVSPRGQGDAGDAAPSAADGGAALVVPAAGAQGVPPNLLHLVVAAAGPIDPVLMGPDGAPVPIDPELPSTPSACDAPYCALRLLRAPLEPQARYTVLMGEVAQSFETAAQPDTRAPGLVLQPLEVEGRCAIVHLASDEPVTAELRDARGRTIARHDVAALEQEVGAAPSAGSYVVAIARDLAGNVAGAQLDLPAPADGALRLVVTEVLSHPVGPQPAQEWVELWNPNGTAVATAGLTIGAGGGTDPLPTALVPAGGYALVAGAGFLTDDGEDVPPAPGTALLRLASSAIGAGLANGAGAPVELRDGAGRLLSRYGGQVDFSARTAGGHSAVRIDPFGCDVRANWRASPEPTPGRPGP